MAPLRKTIVSHTCFSANLYMHAHIRMRRAACALCRGKMAFKVNCVICSKSQDKLLTEWKTFDFNTTFRTFREYFTSPQLVEIFSGTEFQNLQLKEARIGTSKIDCDPVDLDLDMHHAMEVFGRYVKFIVDDCVTQ